MKSFNSAALNLEIELFNFQENEPLNAKTTGFIFELFDELINTVSYYRPLVGKIRNYLHRAIYSSHIKSSNYEDDEYFPYFELSKFFKEEHPEVKILKEKNYILDTNLSRQKMEKLDLTEINSHLQKEIQITGNKLKVVQKNVDLLKTNNLNINKEIKNIKKYVIQSTSKTNDFLALIKTLANSNATNIINLAQYSKLYSRINTEFSSLYIKDDTRKKSASSREKENKYQLDKSKEQLIDLHGRLLTDFENSEHYFKSTNIQKCDIIFKEASQQIFDELDLIKETQNYLKKPNQKNILNKRKLVHDSGSSFVPQNLVKDINNNVNKMISMFTFENIITKKYIPRNIGKKTLQTVIGNFIGLFEDSSQKIEFPQTFQEYFGIYLLGQYGFERTVSLVICDICNSIHQHSDDYKIAKIFENCINNESSVSIFRYIKLVRDLLSNFKMSNIEDFNHFMSRIYPFFKDEDYANAELSFLTFGGRKYSKEVVMDYIIDIVALSREPRITRLVKGLRHYCSGDEGTVREDQLVFVLKEILGNFDIPLFNELLKDIYTLVISKDGINYYRIELLAELAAYFDLKNFIKAGLN